MTDSTCMHAFDLPKRSNTCAATINKKQHGGISLDIILGSNLSVSVPFFFFARKNRAYPYHLLTMLEQEEEVAEEQLLPHSL
jgi:hypothetical protein